MYHVYNRGLNKQIIFNDDGDKDYFLRLFERYLSDKDSLGNQATLYSKYLGKLELVSYCLMNNHFHLLIHQIEQGSLQKFMQSLINSYIHYFNKKYERRGPLFESRYKASLIQTRSYFDHISRYIHLNPVDWQTYNYSSLSYYLRDGSPDWLNPQIILESFADDDYLVFMKDYEAHKEMLDEMKHDLADINIH